jgi:hypothetical protein
MSFFNSVPCPAGSLIDQGFCALEVVDVDNVLRRRRHAVHLFQQRLDRRHLAGAGQTADINVVTGRADVEPQLDGLERARLSQHAVQRRRVFRRFELEAGRITTPAELGGR